MGRLLKFLFGLTIGAGAALLVTPKTGREVRGMLSGSQVRGLMPARLAELSRPRDYSEPEGAATAVAEPPAPVAEAEPSFVPEPVVEPEPEPVAEAEPVVEPEPEPVVEAEPVFVPVPVVEPEPVAEAEPVFVPAPVAEAEPVFVPVPVVESEPVAAAEPAAEPVVEAEPVFVPEPVVEPEPEPVAAAEPEPLAPDEDLRARIEETKADVVSEIQKPFQVAEEPTAVPAPEPVAETEPVAEAEPEPDHDHATLEANLGFVGASSALEESGERSAGLADESPGASDIPAVMSDENAPQGETPPVDERASEGSVVTLVPDLQTPVADSESAPSHDVWPADPVPATFEPELVEEPAAESAPVAEPIAPEASEAPGISEAPVAAEPLEAAVEPAVAEAPVVAEPLEAPVAPLEAEPVVAEAPVEAEPVIAEAPVEAEPVIAEAPVEAEPVVAETPLEAEPVVAEAPVAAEPLRADESAPEEPADEASLGNIDQAEMRRRIEETRARLKAKAFDAMMSGEAALLARDSGEKPVPRGTDVPVDHDVAETLDESLSQDDY